MENKSATRFFFFSFILITACAPSFKQLVVPENSIERQAAIPDYKIKLLPADDEFPPILHFDGWYAPEPLAAEINTAGLEDSPYITPDGKTLFFFFTPDTKKPAEEQLVDGATGIYWSKWIEESWSTPERIPLTRIGEISLDGCPTFINNTLWFCSAREANTRAIDFWQADWSGTEWVNLRISDKRLNEELAIGEMHISSDGNTIFFHHEDESGTNLDIFSSKTQNGRYNAALPVHLVNSPADDSRPALSPDSQTLWFTRTYEGSPAIFRSVLSEKGWGQPELIISRFAGEPSVDAEGNIYFTHHFFKENQMIEADIYIAKKK